MEKKKGSPLTFKGEKCIGPFFQERVQSFFPFEREREAFLFFCRKNA
jgi:hypothetical protein